MKIKWTEETWYSKLLALIFLLGVLPLLSFELGMNYEEILSAPPLVAISPFRNFSPQTSTLSGNISADSSACLSVLRGSYASETITNVPLNQMTYANQSNLQETMGDYLLAKSISNAIRCKMGKVIGSSGKEVMLYVGAQSSALADTDAKMRKFFSAKYELAEFPHSTAPKTP